MLLLLPCTVFLDSCICILLLALRVQSIAVADNKPYVFPIMREIADLSLSNGSLASISIPASLLEKRASGKVHGGTQCNEFATILYLYATGRMSVLVASVLFTTIQAFLPTSSSRSKAIHIEQICTKHCVTLHESHDILCAVLVELLSHW